MSRIRTIKPAFFRSLTVADLTVTARLTFIGLWTYVDDDGRGIDDVRLVKAEVWPLDDKHTTGKVDADLKALEKHDHICRYQASDGRFLHVVEWGHQKISHPQPSTKPPCPIHDNTGTPPDPLRNRSGSHPEPNGTNRERSRTPAEGSGVILPRAGADLDLDFKDSSPVFTGTHDADPQAVENRDLDVEQPPPKPGDLTAALAAIGNRGWDSDPPTGPAWVDPLANRLVAVCAGQRPETIRREADALTAWARRHVDDQVIDEAVGYLEQADQKPNLPRAAAKLIRAKAADHGIQIPEFKPPTRAAS